MEPHIDQSVNSYKTLAGFKEKSPSLGKDHAKVNSEEGLKLPNLALH